MSSSSEIKSWTTFAITVSVLSLRNQTRARLKWLWDGRYAGQQCNWIRGDFLNFTHILQTLLSAKSHILSLPGNFRFLSNKLGRNWKGIFASFGSFFSVRTNRISVHCTVFVAHWKGVENNVTFVMITMLSHYHRHPPTPSNPPKKWPRVWCFITWH